MERFFNEPIMVDWCGDKCFPVVLIGTETMGGFEDGIPVKGGDIINKSEKLLQAFNNRISKLNLPSLDTLRGKVAVCNVARKVESNIPLEVNPEDYKADQIFGDAKEGEEDHVSVYKKIIFNGEWILSKLLEGKCVYVHCNAGASRSPTVVAKVIMNYLGESVKEAEERMKKHAPKMNGDDRINISNFTDLLINGNDYLMRAIEEELALQPEPTLEPEPALEPEPQLQEEDNLDKLVEDMNEYLKSKNKPPYINDLNTVRYLFRKKGQEYKDNTNISMDEFFQIMEEELNKDRGSDYPNFVYVGDSMNWFKEDGNPLRYAHGGFPYHNTILFYMWIIKHAERLKEFGINGIALEFVGHSDTNIQPQGINWIPVDLGDDKLYFSEGIVVSTNAGFVFNHFSRLLRFLKEALDKNGIRILPLERKIRRGSGSTVNDNFNPPGELKYKMKDIDNPKILITVGSAYLHSIPQQESLLTLDNIFIYNQTQIDEFKQKLSELESTKTMIMGMGQGFQADTKDIDADILRLKTKIQKATESISPTPSDSSEKKRLSESIKHKEGTLQMFIQEGTPTDQLIKEIDTLKVRLQTMQGGSKRGRRRRRRSTRRR